MKRSQQGIAALTGPMVLLFRRVRAHWRLLLVLLTGVVTTTTLLASAPLFLAAIKDMGLQHSLRNEQTGVLDTAIRVPYRPLDASTLEGLDRRVQEKADEALDGLVILRVIHVRTPAMDLTTPPARAIPQSVMANLQSFSGYEQHAKAVAGRFPRYPTEQDRGAIEGAVGAEAARALGLQVGDRIILSPATADPTKGAVVHITGFLEAEDPSAVYWSFALSPFSLQSDASGGGEVPMLPVLMHPEALTNEVPALLRGGIADYWWYFYVEPALIRGEEAEPLRSRLLNLETTMAVEMPGSNVFTGLTDTLAMFDQKLFFSSIPVLVLLVLVVALVLYYIVLVANMVVDRHLDEVALFRSRGAKGSQVFAVYLWEAAIIAVIAGAAAPFIGGATVPLLGLLPGFSAATEGSLLPVTLSRTAWAFAIGGAALSFIALLLPALRGARFNLLNARARVARPPALSAAHKYHLDLFLLLMTVVLYWELTQRGSLVTRRLFGAESTDYLLLMMPVMLMAGAALLVLRVVPFVLVALSRAAAFFGRVWLVLALWTIARNPVHHIRPAVLLSLVAGLAMFAASFNATVGASYEDRGRYSAGSDVLISQIPPSLGGSPGEMAAMFEEQPGVRYAAAGFRSAPRRGSDGSFNILALHTTDIQRVSWQRDDFLSPQQFFTLLRRLDRGGSITRGLDLPADAAALSLWVKPAEAYPSTTLWFRVRDAEGRSWRLRAGRLDFNDWRLLEAPLEGAPGVPLTAPLVLEAVLVRELDPKDAFIPFDQLAIGLVTTAHLNISDLRVITAGEVDGVVLDSFKTPGKWHVLATSALLPEKLATSDEDLRDSAATTEFSWQSAGGVGTRGIFPSDFHEPLPIVAGGTFLAATGSVVGDVVDITVEGVPMPAKIVDRVSFFPTMDPGYPFILANVETLLYQANLIRSVPALGPNEVWVSLEKGEEERRAFVAWLRDSPYSPFVAQDLGETLDRLRRDPLVGASSRGVVFTAFAVLLLVGAGGYLGYVYVSSFRASGEFAVLRALGLSGPQLLLVQLIVHGVVLIGSALLGAWVGVQSHEAMIEFLQHTERGAQVLPPLTPIADWLGLWVVLATFSMLLLLIVLRFVWDYQRVRVWLVLRRGGE